MNVIETIIPDVLIIEPDVFGDNRGFFMEIWNKNRYANAGIDVKFVQDNLSSSKKGVLRGLHFQNPNSQGKLVYVLKGEVFDVAIDIRVGSPYFGQWFGITLSDQNRRQLYIPEGFAHGFCVLTDTVLFAYKCTDLYNPHAEAGIRWDDPDIGIEWPITNPILSKKDTMYPGLREIDEELLPRYGGK
jgi:dTDP-4-dehydrorhamnose 3,5-epimerase